MKQAATGRDRAKSKHPRTRTNRAVAALTELQRLLDARVRRLERRFRGQISGLRAELQAGELGLMAAELRTLNERQSSEGVSRLLADLETMRERGVIDERGRRIRQDLPPEMRQPTTCDV